MGENRLMADLYAENERLKARISELESKHFVECTQIAQYSDENAKLKELLKEAVDDFQFLSKQYCEKNCACCPLDKEDFCEWKHQDEALALIGEGTNVPASADDTNVDHKSGSWISCEDRLPSENTLVLCYARSTTGEGNGYFLGGLALGEFWFLKVNDIGHVSYPVPHWEVTHWQPLPEPPKDGDEK